MSDKPKVLCEKCKKEVADREVVLTQKEVDEGKTVESKTQRRIASKDEVVKTQADVDAENVAKKKPIEEVEPAAEAKPKKKTKKKK